MLAIEVDRQKEHVPVPSEHAAWLQKAQTKGIVVLAKRSGTNDDGWEKASVLEKEGRHVHMLWVRFFLGCVPSSVCFGAAFACTKKK